MLQTAFLTVAGFSLQTTVVILVVILARLVLRRLGAPTVVSYALWAVVLFRLLCLVSLESPVGVIPAEIAELPAQRVAADDGYYDSVPDDVVLSPELPAEDDVPEYNTDLTYFELEIPREIVRRERLALLPGAIWAVGVAALVVYSVVAYFRLRRRLVGAVPLEGNIRLADRIGSPFVMGLFRPKIYLPSDLPEREREYIILHERYHIRRLDHIVKILAFAALCIHWFNPLVWLAFHLSGKDMEMSCDEAVVKKLGEGIRADYSASLLSLATGRTVIAATPLAFGEGNTKGRIKNLAKWKKPAVWITVVAILLCAAVILLFATNNGGRESRLDVRFGSGGVEIDCRFDDDTQSWAIYQDVYLEGKLISSTACISDTFVENGGASERDMTMTMKAVTTAAESGGFTGALRCSCEGTGLMQWELALPRDHYAASGTTLGDGSKKESAIRKDLRDDGEAILFSVMFSTEPGIVPVHKEKGITGANDTVVQYRLVTADYVRDWTQAPEQPPRQFGADQVYVSERCLYMTGLSSYLAAGGDSGYCYVMGDGGFTMVRRSTGAETVLAEGENWAKWEEFPWSDEEWKALFWPDGMGALDIGGYKEKSHCELKGGHHLLQMDGELWLMNLSSNEQMGTYVWDIYHLVPQNTKGAAQWEFAPILSSREPYFKFVFDMEYDEISTFCSDGKLEITEGAARWYPMDENGAVAAEAELSFAMNREGQTTRFCTVYIQGSTAAGEGRTVYTATLTGTGLVMEQNPNGGAVIRIAGSTGKTGDQLELTLDSLDELFQTVVEERTPVYLKLTPAGAGPGSTYSAYGAWGCPNSVQSANALLAYDYQPVSTQEAALEIPVGGAKVTLLPAGEDAGWSVDFYAGSDLGVLNTERESYYFRAAPQTEDAFLSPLGSLIRRWYDEAEFKAIGGYDGANIIIPNTGQSDLEAARAWCEAYEGLHLKVSPGSKECYTHVSCRVEQAEGATDLYREEGKIGENGCAFYVHTAFVPENEQARQYSIASNAVTYEGNDPAVPKDALEYSKCGYITLEEDGWYGIIVGTGW